jgi:hypothetical protein
MQAKHYLIAYFDLKSYLNGLATIPDFGSLISNSHPGKLDKTWSLSRKVSLKSSEGSSLGILKQHMMIKNHTLAIHNVFTKNTRYDPTLSNEQSLDLRSPKLCHEANQAQRS